LKESLTLVAIGVIIGLAAAFVAGRFVATLLSGLASPAALGKLLATAVMVAVATVASYLPAKRASRVDPMVALHYE
jgi:ABC-type antimicrobial peptide transport system permease subunit